VACALGVALLAVIPEEGEEPMAPPGAALDEASKAMQLEGLFLFSMVWSVGATCEAAGRAAFDKFFRWGESAAQSCSLVEDTCVYRLRSNQNSPQSCLCVCMPLANLFTFTT
jgi:hypothetical protein